jgi:hypothetical protein
MNNQKKKLKSTMKIKMKKKMNMKLVGTYLLKQKDLKTLKSIKTQIKNNKVRV